MTNHQDINPIENGITTPAARFYAELAYGDNVWDSIESDDPYAIEAWVRDVSPVIVDDERYDGEGDYVHGSIRWGLTAER